MRDYQALRDRDARDAHALSYTLSAPLRHCVGTSQCKHPPDCPMCSNAARLAVQTYRPIIERRMVEHIVHEYDAGCRMAHPGSD